MTYHSRRRPYDEAKGAKRGHSSFFVTVSGGLLGASLEKAGSTASSLPEACWLPEPAISFQGLIPFSLQIKCVAPELRKS